MSARLFSVRCTVIDQPASAPTRFGAPSGASSQDSKRLIVELMTGGLEDVMVLPDGQGDRLTIRGRAPAESKEAARALV